MCWLRGRCSRGLLHPKKRRGQTAAVRRQTQSAQGWSTEEAGIYEGLPHEHIGGVVHVENMNRGATDGRSSDQRGPLPAKVVSPAIFSRVEQSSGSATRRFSARDVRSFVQIAVETRQGDIAERGLATVLLSDDVVD